MNPQLPDAVQTYFGISNGGDVSQLASCFCAHASVIDENRMHVGLRAIEAWQLEARQAFIYQVHPLKALHEEGRVVVTARLAGNFPGSPVQLNHLFTLEGDQIHSLEITPC